MGHRFRQKAMQRTLAENKLDAVLVTHPPNVRYLCGFTGSAGALMLSENKSVFFTDGRYAEQSRAEVRGPKILIAPEEPLIRAGKWLASKESGFRKKANIGIEGDFLTVAGLSRLKSVLGKGIQLIASPTLTEQARLIKDEDELVSIRAAASLGEKLWKQARSLVRPGVKEAHISAELEYAARRAGAQGMSFDTIIASGKRSALPHGVASVAAIPAQGFVVCDFGVILSGYCSDMTRTIFVGQPSKDYRRAYEAVRRAQEAAVAAVKPGAVVGDVDSAARNLLKLKGLEKYFTHSTGHGVGLEIHESPRIASGRKEILKPGMVITIEPGVYVPGEYGIRIEDMVLVTEQGREVLTPSSKELFTI
ncbi:MAG: Xaa-Pro peptidase family protein [Acidobacteriota bacterium]|nr:Xaa-Pro peptidase family protein [Acidobacteriota bacterium]